MKNKKKRLFLGVWLLLCLAAAGCGSKHGEEMAPLPLEAEESGTPSIAAETEQEEPLPDTIWADICGEVMQPGVYELPAGSRLYELVEAAGGFTLEAEPRSVNQARVLTDGEQVQIISREAYEAGGGEALPSEKASRGKVDLNGATEEELSTLSGIGPAKAAAIVAYRKEHGAFSSVEELMEVSGIGSGTFEKIKDDIMVS